MNEEELVKNALELARNFYIKMGYNAKKGFKFYESQHPQELLVWEMAVIAYEHIHNTDIEDALATITDN